MLRFVAVPPHMHSAGNFKHSRAPTSRPMPIASVFRHLSQVLKHSGIGLGPLNPVPDWFRHCNFCSLRYRTDCIKKTLWTWIGIHHALPNCRWWKVIRPCTSIHGCCWCAIEMQLHTGAEHYGNVIFRYSELTSQYHFDTLIDVNRTWGARDKTTVSQSGTVAEWYSFKR